MATKKTTQTDAAGTTTPAKPKSSRTKRTTSKVSAKPKSVAPVEEPVVEAPVTETAPTEAANPTPVVELPAMAPTIPVEVKEVVTAPEVEDDKPDTTVRPGVMPVSIGRQSVSDVDAFNQLVATYESTVQALPQFPKQANYDAVGNALHRLVQFVYLKDSSDLFKLLLRFVREHTRTLTPQLIKSTIDDYTPQVQAMLSSIMTFVSATNAGASVSRQLSIQRLQTVLNRRNTISSFPTFLAERISRQAK